MIKKILFFGLLWCCSAMMQAQQRPNIIFFVVDDLGYMDLGCYGSTTIKTPNIDALASDGIRFTHHYAAAPRCAASRTSMMTGKFESRPSVATSMYLASDNNVNGYAETTWAQALKDNGYKTFFIGKWHLGHDTSHYPDDFGFDINIAGDEHGSPPTYWYPYAGIDEETGLTGSLNTAVGTGAVDITAARHSNFIGANGVAGAAPATGEEEEYLTDRITWEVNDFIHNHVTTTPTVPFMAMVAHYGVHVPFEAKSSYVSTAQTDINNAGFTGAEFVQDLTTETKLQQDNATYNAMIKSIDDSLGAIRQKLVAEGIANNTIIVLTSDNGGLSTNEHGSNRERATSNKPLRMGKTWLYDGGIRLPLIVYGPNYRSGVVEDEPVINTDYFPTFLEMGDTALMPTQHLDGESFEKLLLTSANGGDANYTKTKPMFWNFDYASGGTADVSMAAYREGQYKLCELKYTSGFELYDVVNDPGETTDLSASMPAKVAELKDKLFQFRTDAGISHRVTNTGFINVNKRLYDAMNTAMGTNVQASYGCAEPNGTTNDIIYNGGFDCWYDLDWSLYKDAAYSSGAATFADAGVNSRTGGKGAKVTVATGGSVGKIRLVNSTYYGNFKGGDLTLSVYAKSPVASKFKYQILVKYADGTSATYLSPSNFTTTSTYAKYSYTFPTATISTKETTSIEVRIQCGLTVGDIYFDDFEGKVSGITLSTPLTEEESAKLVSYDDDLNSIVLDTDTKIGQVYVIDATGSVVKLVKGNVKTIHVGTLSKGIYIVKVFLENGKIATKKIAIF